MSKTKKIVKTKETVLEETLEAAKAVLEIIIHNLEWIKK